MPASIAEYTGDGHLRWQRRATTGASLLTLREIFAISRRIIFSDTPTFAAMRVNFPLVIHLNAYSPSIFIAMRLPTSG